MMPGKKRAGQSSKVMYMQPQLACASRLPPQAERKCTGDGHACHSGHRASVRGRGLIARHAIAFPFSAVAVAAGQALQAFTPALIRGKPWHQMLRHFWRAILSSGSGQTAPLVRRRDLIRGRSRCRLIGTALSYNSLTRGQHCHRSG